MWPFGKSKREKELEERVEYLKEDRDTIKKAHDDFVMSHPTAQSSPITGHTHKAPTPTPVFSESDSQRLKQLTNERLREQKKERIQSFMDLPDDTREKILVSTRLCNFANKLQQDKQFSNEEAQLLNKQCSTMQYIGVCIDDGSSTRMQVHIGNDTMQVWLNDPKGLTLEDLEHAHAGKAIDDILLADTDTKD